ncbi:hypothetical protein D3C85_1635750 [compost metagenome]
MIHAARQFGNFIAPGNGERFGQIAAGNFTDVRNHPAQRVKQNGANAIPHANQHNH